MWIYLEREELCLEQERMNQNKDAKLASMEELEEDAELQLLLKANIKCPQSVVNKPSIYIYTYTTDNCLLLGLN